MAAPPRPQIQSSRNAGGNVVGYRDDLHVNDTLILSLTNTVEVTSIDWLLIGRPELSVAGGSGPNPWPLGSSLTATLVVDNDSGAQRDGTYTVAAIINQGSPNQLVLTTILARNSGLVIPGVSGDLTLRKLGVFEALEDTSVNELLAGWATQINRWLEYTRLYAGGGGPVTSTASVITVDDETSNHLPDSRQLKVASGKLTLTDAGAGSTLTLSLPNLVTAGSVGGSNRLVSFAFDAQGRITAASSGAAVALAATQVIAGAGMTGGGAISSDVTLNVVAGDATIVVDADDIKVGVIQAGNIAAGVIPAKGTAIQPVGTANTAGSNTTWAADNHTHLGVLQVGAGVNTAIGGTQNQPTIDAWPTVATTVFNADASIGTVGAAYIWTGFTASHAANLPSLASVANRTVYSIVDNSGAGSVGFNLSITPNGSDVINGVNAAFVLPTGVHQGTLLMKTSVGWVTFGGGSVLKGTNIQPVAIANAPGSSQLYAAEDHAHLGVHSVTASGSPNISISGNTTDITLRGWPTAVSPITDTSVTIDPSVSTQFIWKSFTSNRTLTLTQAQAFTPPTGQLYGIKDASSNTGFTLSIIPNGTDTINGVNANFVLPTGVGRSILLMKTEAGAWITFAQSASKGTGVLPVASANAAGASQNFAAEDHTHQGVFSVAAGSGNVRVNGTPNAPTISSWPAVAQSVADLNINPGSNPNAYIWTSITADRNFNLISGGGINVGDYYLVADNTGTVGFNIKINPGGSNKINGVNATYLIPTGHGLSTLIMWLGSTDGWVTFGNLPPDPIFNSIRVNTNSVLSGAVSVGGNLGVGASFEVNATTGATTTGNLEIDGNILLTGTGVVKTITAGTNVTITGSATNPVIHAAAGGASALATYVVNAAANAPVNAQVLSSLATGLAKITTGTGVITIASAGTDYENPLTFVGPLTRSTNSISIAAGGIVTSLIAAGAVGTPQLATTGVSSGTYTNANITVGADGRITAASNGSAGGGGANALGSYIVQTAANAPVNAQILASLGTGLMKNASATGVVSIATPGSDYEVPLSFSGALGRSSNIVTIKPLGIQSSMIDNHVVSDTQLTFTGATGGAYIRPNLTITSSGRITAAASWQPQAPFAWSSGNFPIVFNPVITYNQDYDFTLIFQGGSGGSVGLPSSGAPLGTKVTVKDQGGNAGTAGIVVSQSGGQVEGEAFDIINANFMARTYQLASTNQWIIISEY